MSGKPGDKHMAGARGLELLLSAETF